MQQPTKTRYKQDKNKKDNEIIKVAPGEWEAAEKIAKAMKDVGFSIPCKLSKKRIESFIEPPSILDGVEKKDVDCLKHSLYISKNGTIGLFAIAKDQEEGYLGKGAFGDVKSVLLSTGKVVAVKIEPTVNESKQGDVERRMVELKILKVLNRYEDDFIQQRDKKTEWRKNTEIPEIKDKMYTLQEKLPGMDMSDYIQPNGVLPKNTPFNSLDKIAKLEVGLNAASEVKKLHDNGFLHCDIKPANFMIDKNRNVAITDFGFSMDLEGKEKLIGQDAIGTPFYIAPEITETVIRDINGEAVSRDYTKKSKKEYSKASDVFALGIMFRVNMHLDKLGDPDLANLVKDMTHNDPSKRPTIEMVTAKMQSLKEKDEKQKKLIEEKKQLEAKKQFEEQQKQKKLIEEQQRHEAQLDSQLKEHKQTADVVVNKAIVKIKAFVSDIDKEIVEIGLQENKLKSIKSGQGTTSATREVMSNIAERVNKINELCKKNEEIVKGYKDEVHNAIINCLKEDALPKFLSTKEELKLFEQAKKSKTANEQDGYINALESTLSKKLNFVNMEEKTKELNQAAVKIQSESKKTEKVLVFRDSAKQKLDGLINSLTEAREKLIGLRKASGYTLKCIFSFGIYYALYGAPSKKAEKEVDNLINDIKAKSENLASSNLSEEESIKYLEDRVADVKDRTTKITG